MEIFRIGFASDHRGGELKNFLINSLKNHLSNSFFLDFNLSSNESLSIDYPEVVLGLRTEWERQQLNRGILICGTGVGVSMVANRHSGWRAALVTNPWVAVLSREHNDSNILCLGADVLAPSYAFEIALRWFQTSFSGEARHQRRLRQGGLC